MILKIAKSQANDLPAEARASLGQKRKEMDRIEYELERSDLLDKTAFIDRQEQIRTKTDLMTGVIAKRVIFHSAQFRRRQVVR
jgi:SMC interacting uncharacterized protein involved in chromosome segregation